jgi:dienelactone hydrolase
MRFALITAFILTVSSAFAEIRTASVDYSEGSTRLQGFVAYDAKLKGKRPGILIVHDWNSIDEYERGRARQLAAMGYVAFAADIYGKGVRPKNQQESAAESGKYRNDRALLRARVLAGLQELRRNQRVDRNKIAAIGYCFGGTSVLELARSGADVRGVVSFHGGLSTPTPADAQNIKGKVLVCHGDIDPFVPHTEVDAFLKEMRDAKVDYQFIAYANAVHSFTEPKAGSDPSKGQAYNRLADMRSWVHMKDFFREIFK